MYFICNGFISANLPKLKGSTTWLHKQRHSHSTNTNAQANERLDTQAHAHLYTYTTQHITSKYKVTKYSRQSYSDRTLKDA